MTGIISLSFETWTGNYQSLHSADYEPFAAFADCFLYNPCYDIAVILGRLEV